MKKDGSFSAGGRRLKIYTSQTMMTMTITPIGTIVAIAILVLRGSFSGPSERRSRCKEEIKGVAKESMKWSRDPSGEI
jgi:hypothetical protein